MTTEEIRSMFDQLIFKLDGKDQIAKVELVREFFTNQKFRKELEDFVWDINTRAIDGLGSK